MRILPVSPLEFHVGETNHPIELFVRDCEIDPTGFTAEFQLLRWADRTAAIDWTAAEVSEIVEHPTPSTSYWSFRLTMEWTVDEPVGVYLGFFRLATVLGAKWVVPQGAGLFLSIYGALPE